MNITITESTENVYHVIYKDHHYSTLQRDGVWLVDSVNRSFVLHLGPENYNFPQNQSK